MPSIHHRANDRIVMLEPSCIFDFHDIAVLRAAMRWRQVEALDASAVEAAVREMRAVEKRAEVEAVALRISGAQGPYADVINGLFERTDDEKDGPVWKQREGDRCLYSWSGKQWWVSNAKDKDARDAHGLARSEVMGRSSLPNDACKWDVFIRNDHYEEQQVRWIDECDGPTSSE